jgi:nicotinamidase-related amidase
MAATDNGSRDLHGNVPDHSGIVLLIVDVINDLDFPDNEQLVRHSARLADSILAMKRRCKSVGIPAIYVNDNRGRWRSDLREVIRQAGRKDAPGKQMVERLTPAPEDYVILKPKHSAFFATPLELILQHLGAHTVVIAGVTTNACVLITAGDVFLRGYRLFVPSDCVAALTQESQLEALKIMSDNFNADTTPSTDLDLEALSGVKERRIA